MYRYQLPKQELYVTFDNGGYGDHIASLPAIKYILDKHPQVDLTLWVPSFVKILARKSLPESKNLAIRTFDEVKQFAKENVPVKKFAGNPYTNLGSHMTEHAFDIIVNSRPDNPNDYNYLPINTKGVYLNKFNLPDKYIILPTGFTASVREFRPTVVNNLIDYILGKGYTPVFLGKSSSVEKSDTTKAILGQFSQEINYDKGINLIDKTDMLETVKIIKGAKTIVGLDNGLIHLACTTDLPVVCGFSSVKSGHRAPYRHGIKGWNFYPVELSREELACTGCQSNMTCTFLKDFRFCFYEDYKCLELLTSDRYAKELEKIL